MIYVARCRCSACKNMDTYHTFSDRTITVRLRSIQPEGDRHGHVTRTPENIIERDAKEQMRRETELAAMYEARQQQQQQQQQSAYTSPSSGYDCISDEVLPTRRQLRDVEPRSAQPQSADGSVRKELNSPHVDERQSPIDIDRRQRRYSSPGEELVYREMMEHKARELELRLHWKEVYGVYIAPLPGDELIAVVPETEVGNKTGNGNDRRKSTGAQCNVRADRGVKENSTPVATGKGRKEGSQRDENETTTPANQRPRSQQLTRTMSDTYISRYEGREAKSSRKAGQQRETTVDDQRSSGEQATKRKSLNEAERRIEDEVVEAMRREQELRQLRESIKHLYASLDLACEDASDQ